MVEYNIIKLTDVTAVTNAARWYLSEGFIEIAEGVLQSLSGCIQHGRLH